MFDDLKAWLAEKLRDFTDWILEAVQWLGKKLFSGIMDALSTFISAIPVPDFIGQAASYFGGIPSNIAWAIQFFAVNEGLLMITSALVLRFILRRIPLIG